MVRSRSREVEVPMRAHHLLLCFLLWPGRLDAQSISVVELEQHIARIGSPSDQKAARALEHVRLDERLSSDQLARLLPRLPGERSRVALLGIADASTFLDPPRSEYVMLVAPSVVEQGKILSRAYDFVVNTIAKLPDFIASRELTRMQSVVWPRYVSKGDVHRPAPFRKEDRSTSEVVYRDGSEVLGSGDHRGEKRPKGLTAYGIFGPLLQSTVSDILRGKVAWSYWQRTAMGRAAVFRYRVEITPHFKVGFCCINGKGVEFRPPYHGEITIEPDTGRVLRIVIQTEPPDYRIRRADVAVDYGFVTIGGVHYLCPVRSVALATAPMSDERRTGPESPAMLAGEITSINHMEYRDYHVFRSEMRIVPTDSSALPPPER